MLITAHVEPSKPKVRMVITNTIYGLTNNRFEVNIAVVVISPASTTAPVLQAFHKQPARMGLLLRLHPR